MAAIDGGPWATGIGSLPFEAATAFDEARDLAAKFEDELPFQFELPRAFPDDALVRRPFAGALEPGDMAEARLQVPTAEARERDTKSVSYAQFVGTVLASPRRWIKFQVAGPVALGNYVSDKSGKPLGTTPEGRDLVLSRIEKIAHQYCRNAAASGKGQTTPIVFLDEPGVSAATAELGKAVELVRKLGAIVGVHDCGPDFRNALAAKPDLVSFDFATYGPHVGEPWDALREFVQAGGAIAWGAISTAPTARRFDPSVTAGAVRTAALRLMGSEKSARELLARSLVTPACGTALLEPHHAVSLHERAIAIAKLLRMK